MSWKEEDGRPAKEAVSGRPIDAATVGTKLGAIRRRIAAAGGDPDGVTIVAVTKGFPAEVAQAAIQAGIRDLGENYAQELLAKAPDVAPSARWHFQGPLQRNKVPALSVHVNSWDSIDRVAVGETLARRQPGARVLVQVNATGDEHQHGCPPTEVPDLVIDLQRLGLDVAGLMTIGPLGAAEAARPAFRLVADLGRQLGLAELSMGMTDDLEVAVQEGATVVRIGRGLFGQRDRKPAPATVGS